MRFAAREIIDRRRQHHLRHASKITAWSKNSMYKWQCDTIQLCTDPQFQTENSSIGLVAKKSPVYGPSYRMAPQYHIMLGNTVSNLPLLSTDQWYYRTHIESSGWLWQLAAALCPLAVIIMFLLLLASDNFPESLSTYSIYIFLHKCASLRYLHRVMIMKFDPNLI